MRFLIITHVVHKNRKGIWYAYGPYVREMDIWTDRASEVTILAPTGLQSPGVIDLAYKHHNIRFLQVPALNFTSAKKAVFSFLRLPSVFWKILSAMRHTEHIHLRCPGNMGLLGCIAQIAFPGKCKTAKYAGNWDWKSEQPLTYRWQQRLLRSKFLTRNMQVLVYGNWPDRNKNLLPFFTASYRRDEIIDNPTRTIGPDRVVRLIYAGTLSSNKQPRMVLGVFQRLLEQGYQIRLDIYGDGPKGTELQEIIARNGWTEIVALHGNASAETMKTAYRQAHFLVSASRSEGWPKVVAEAMFWGCLPVSTAVSCVPEMLGNGQRGVLCEPDPGMMSEKIAELIHNPELYSRMAQNAAEWSQQYTLDRFQSEIQKLLFSCAGATTH